MTSSEMVKELVDKYGFTRYELADEIKCGRTIVYCLYAGTRGGRTSVELHDKIKVAYKKLVKLRGEK